MKKEDQNIEYKQSWRDEYLKWVCGFANADGGRMLIGVMDDKKGYNVKKDGKDMDRRGELILNALVHKDYSSNLPIQISVSDDKIYIVNVGTLPDDWTVKQLLGKHSSRPHNPTIAGWVYLTGMIETWGRGIRKVFDECKKYGCPTPVYEINAGDPGDIMVRIDAAPDTVASQSGEKEEGRTIKRTIKDILLDAIKSHPGIKAPGLMAESGRGRTAVTDALAVLVSEGLVEYRGSRKTGGYYVKG